MRRKSNKAKHFKTNVLLKSIIGKDLINNDNIAVLELAKNAFDAGSRKVEIIFRNVLENGDKKKETTAGELSKIIIQDWGCGMDEDGIADRWLNIAYSDKRHRPSQHGRHMAGAKGIGRFSCDRLGQLLDIFTRKHNGKYFHVHIDWLRFEADNKPEMRIESVNVDVEEIGADELRESGHAPFQHGTIVEISRLRSEWDDPKLRSLRQYLERLLNPNQQFSESPFTLYLWAKEFQAEVNGEVRSRVFDRLEFTSTSIESRISADGKTIHTVLLDKAREIFRLDEANVQFPLLRDVKVVVYYLNQYGKAYFKRTTGQDKISYGSIFLFINGFRIPPYGDEKDDWLGIDRWKSQGFAKYLGTREIVGRIEINDSEGVYKIVSSREGLVKDKRVAQLTERDGFYYLAHRRLESYVVDGLDWDRAPQDEALSIVKKIEGGAWRFNPQEEVYSVDERHKNLMALRSLSSTLNVRPKNVLQLSLNTDLVEELQLQERSKAEQILSQFDRFGKKFNSKTAKALERVQHVLKVQEKQLRASNARAAKLSAEVTTLHAKTLEIGKENLFLRSAISADSKELLALQHQIGLSSRRIEHKLNELRKAISTDAGTEVISQLVNVISLENKKILSVSRFVTKANFSMEAKWIDRDIVQFIREYVDNVYQEYKEFKLNNTQIETRVHTNDLTWECKFAPLEMIIIIDNILDNARKASSTRVDISFEKKDAGLQVDFKDNGKGIPRENLSRIFDFGFTTTSGSGIGLAHVHDIVSRLRGKVTAQSSTSGTTISIRLPR